MAISDLIKELLDKLDRVTDELHKTIDPASINTLRGEIDLLNNKIVALTRKLVK